MYEKQKRSVGSISWIFKTRRHKKIIKKVSAK